MIVDFRIRPPIRSFLKLRLYTDMERTLGRPRKVGLEPAPSVEQKSMDLLLQEMDAAEISTGVIVGRSAGPQWGDSSNDDAASICAEFPGRFVFFASVNPHQRLESLKEIDRAVLQLGAKGISMDPGMLENPMYLNDRRMYPLYQRCGELGVPVLLMAGGFAGPDVSYTMPVWVDQVAADFPELKIIVAHGGWPWVTQICGIALKRQNLYLCPDSYMINVPGVNDYVMAANYYLQDRFVFGSCYPLLPLKETADIFRALPFKPEVLPKLLYGNAKKLLNI